MTLFFSGPVTIDEGVTPDGGFHCDEATPDTATVFDPTTILLNFPAPQSPGNAWTLDAQPNWLLTAADIPESGTLT